MRSGLGNLVLVMPKDEPDPMLRLSQQVLDRSIRELEQKFPDSSWIFVPFMFPGYGPHPEMTVCVEVSDEYYRDLLSMDVIRIFKNHWNVAIDEIIRNRKTIKTI